MMLRKLAVSLAVAGIISATNANALGLGEIKIKSALNEPLDAEIKLLQVRQLSPLQIQPRMADIDDFALAGLDKSRFLTDVSFQVKVNPDGSGVITLKSDRAVREPFLNFLVEVNWPNGRLVREYTLLLDPPVFDQAPSRKTVKPSTSPAKAKAPVNSQPMKVESARQTSTGASQVFVDAKDTLWSIAIKHRPSEKISAKKMMIALQKKNPHAFVNNNINALRAGVMLDLPSMDELNQLNSEAAALEVVRQTSAWKSTDTPANTVDATKKKSTTDKLPEQPVMAGKEEKGAELKIVTPKDDSAAEQAVVTDQSDKASQTDKDDLPVSSDDAEKEALISRNQELEDRLSESLENVDKISLENEDLNQRLDSIQNEIENLRKMIELKDAELASLQNQLNAEKIKTPPAPPPEKSLIDKILQTPAILGGIGAGLIALLVGLFFFLRRGKKDEETPVTEEESALVQVPEGLKADEPDDIVAEDDLKEEIVEEIAEPEEIAAVAEPEEELQVGEEEDLLDDSDLDLDDSDLDDLDDLDLDMDMDLDLEEDAAGDVLETVEQEPEAGDDLDALLDDDEFDLGLDEDLGEEDSEEISDSLDNILDETVEEDTPAAVEEVMEEVEESDALDDILNDAEDSAEDSEIDLGLDDSLEFEVQDIAPEPQPEVDAESIVDEADDALDFVVDEVPELSSDEEDLSSGPEEISAGDLEDIGVDELDESGLDELLDSVSDEDVDALTTAAEQSEDVDDLDDILGELDEDISLETDEGQLSSEPEVDDISDDLDALLAETDDVDLAETGDVDLGDIEEFEPDDALEQMLADNPDPDESALTELLDEQDALDSEELETDEDFDALLAQVDDDIDQAMAEELEAELGAELETEKTEPDVSGGDVALGAAAAATAAVAVTAATSDSSDAAADDLDAMLEDIGMDLDDSASSGISETDEVVLEGDDLEGSIAHDLDSELDALLNSADSEIELEESAADEEDASVDDDFDELAGLNLLEGADEVETKLDLARAYMDMEDLEGAKDILQEIVAEGNDTQKTEAQALIQSINEK